MSFESYHAAIQLVNMREPSIRAIHALAIGVKLVLQHGILRQALLEINASAPTAKEIFEDLKIIEKILII
ncbi:hypothetical protein KKA14_19990 [bacterium]|nr:hypothetical protein [bacterium]